MSARMAIGINRCLLFAVKNNIAPQGLCPQPARRNEGIDATVRTLGLIMPPTPLASADEVIELSP